MKKLILLAVFACVMAGCVRFNAMDMAGLTNGGSSLELGDIYYNSAEPDYDKAAEYYYKAALQNNAEGQHKLAELYEKGISVDKSDSEAIYWYKKSAEQGYVDAQYKYGSMTFEGRGAEADATEAAKWMAKAAAKDNAAAQRQLADFYKDGRGVKQSDKSAVKWYTKAAEQGDADSQMILGDAYMAGTLSLKPDALQSCVWLTVAGMGSLCQALSEKDAAKAKKQAAVITSKITEKQK